MTWADRDYKYKKKLVIPSSKVSGDETNFPIVVNITDTDLKDVLNGGHVQSANGYDICFYNSTETTKYNHDLELYTAATGVLTVWICITSLSSTSNNILYMYYGNPTITTDQSSTDTWDVNYVMILHGDDGADNTEVDDATANNHHGDKNAAGNPTAETGGKIGYAQHGDGTKFATIPDHADFDISNGQISLWFNIDNFNAAVWNLFLSKIPGTSADGNWAIRTFAPNGFVRFYLKSASTWKTVDSDSTSWTSGVWYHVLVQFGTGGVIMYIDNSVQTDTDAATTGINGGAVIDFMTYSDYDSFFDGLLDEVRISNIQRSTNWLTTEYANQNTPTTFVLMGSELGVELYLSGTGKLRFSGDKKLTLVAI